MNPGQYWTMTRGEVIAFLDGRQTHRDLLSANFRNIYGLLIRLGSKSKQDVKKIWPLSIDFQKPELTSDEMFERNKKILSQYEHN